MSNYGRNVVRTEQRAQVWHVIKLNNRFVCDVSDHLKCTNKENCSRRRASEVSESSGPCHGQRATSSKTSHQDSQLLCADQKREEGTRSVHVGVCPVSTHFILDKLLGLSKMVLASTQIIMCMCVIITYLANHAVLFQH